MSSLITTLSDASFDADVLQRSGLTLVDFWAPWCGPCKALAPLLEEVASEYDGEAAVAKINADDNPQSSDRFAVRGLPTLILFRDGVECERVLGLVSKSRLATLIDKHLQAA